MINTKLVELIMNLKPMERGHILEFSQLNYFKLNEAEQKMLQYLVKQINRGKKIDKVSVTQAISPTQPISTKNWNYMTSHLLKFINQFLLLKFSQQYKPYHHIFLCNYFYDNGLDKNLNGELLKFSRTLRNPNKRGHDYHFLEFQYLHIISATNKLQRNFTTDIHNLNQSLDAFYAENKLRLMCEVANQNLIINQPYKADPILDILLKNIITNHFYKSKSIAIYCWILQLFTHSDKAVDYTAPKTLFKKHHAIFKKDEQKVICQYLINYAMNRLNQGELAFAYEFLEYVDFLIGQKMLLEKKQLHASFYKNIVSAGLMAKKLS